MDNITLSLFFRLLQIRIIRTSLMETNSQNSQGWFKIYIYIFSFLLLLWILNFLVLMCEEIVFDYIGTCFYYSHTMTLTYLLFNMWEHTQLSCLMSRPIVFPLSDNNVHNNVFDNFRKILHWQGMIVEIIEPHIKWSI